jgi:hypothetical protein
MHEKAQKIWVFIESQKVGEKCASENRVETQARRQEGSRRDWHGLNAQFNSPIRWDLLEGGSKVTQPFIGSGHLNEKPARNSASVIALQPQCSMQSALGLISAQQPDFTEKPADEGVAARAFPMHFEVADISIPIVVVEVDGRSAGGSLIRPPVSRAVARTGMYLGIDQRQSVNSGEPVVRGKRVVGDDNGNHTRWPRPTFHKWRSVTRSSCESGIGGELTSLGLRQQ